MNEHQTELKQILDLYGNEMDDKGKFYHLLEQIGKHLIKLTKLKENEDRPGHFKEEVADIYLLSALLVKLEDVDDAVVKEAAGKFRDKIQEIYRK